MNKLSTSEMTGLNSLIEWGIKLRMKQWISEKKTGVLPETHCHGTVLITFKSYGDIDS